MSIKSVIPPLGCLLIGLGLWQSTLPQRAQSQEVTSPAAGKQDAAQKQPAVKKELTTQKPEAKNSGQPKSSADLDLLRASAAEFEKAFNAHDAQAIAALFAEKAETVDEDGSVLEGRANIAARFAELFKNHPQSSIAVEITSLRQLSPDVAVEDGVSTVTLDPQEAGSRSPYSLVHVKRDGKWLFASVRDFPEESTPTAHDHLTDLEWLVGHWVDESREGRVETTCQWSADGNFLLQDYVIKPHRGGELRGTQRIGWDPLRQMIRGWVFDQSGGIVESSWVPVEGTWIVKAEGATADGQPCSATRLITPLTSDSYQINSSNQVFGGELLPDSSVRVVRRPPDPAK